MKRRCDSSRRKFLPIKDNILIPICKETLILNIGNDVFDSMVNRIYPSELQLNKANVSHAEASFLDLHLSVSDGFVKTKIYGKRDDFDFDIVIFSYSRW